MDETNPSEQPHHHQQPPPSSSSTPSSSANLPPPPEMSPFMQSYMQMYAKLYAAMRVLCAKSDMDEVQKAFHDGDEEKAHNIIKRVFENYTASGDLYRIQAEWCAEMAETNANEKEMFVTQGITSAKRSVQLSNDDIRNRIVSISLLSQHPRPQERQRVIQECKDALQIDEFNDQYDSARSKIINFLCQREKEERINSVWELTTQGNFLQVQFSDLERYFSSLTDEPAKEALDIVTEAWAYGNSHSYWKFWQCCCCDMKFDRSNLFFRHFADTHLTPKVKSIICAGSLEKRRSIFFSAKRFFPEQENIFVDAVASHLLFSPNCLLSFNTDASATAFPPLHPSVTTRSYQSGVNEWTRFSLARKHEGGEFLEALEKMYCQEEANSNEETEMALERLSEDIDSEIKNNFAWILRYGKEKLTIVENPFGAYDYRKVLLPILKAYIARWVEMEADKEVTDKSDARAEMKTAGN